MKLSIIVPVYNAEKWLRRCVESLLNQDIDKSEYEILLIDDGSKDGSLALAQQLATEASNIRVFTQPNAGPGAARNRGIDNATGDYLMFVDADDTITNNLGDCIRIAINNNADICVFGMLAQNEDGTFRPTKENASILSGEQYFKKHYREIGSACSRIFATTFIHRYNQRFNTQLVMHEDAMFMYIAIGHAKKIITFPTTLYAYYHTPNSRDQQQTATKVYHSISCDILIATTLREMSNVKHNFNKRTKRHLCRCSNSISIGILRQIIQKKSRLKNHYNILLTELNKSKLFPLSFTSNSLKSTLLIPLLNALYYLKFNK